MTIFSRSPGIEKISATGRFTALVLTELPRVNGRPHTSIAIPNRSQWQAWIEELLYDGVGERPRAYLKRSPSVKVFRSTLPHGHVNAGTEVVCKLTPRSGIIDRLRRSRAMRNFDRGWMLLRAGISTAVPLAVIERNTPRRESILVMQFVPDLLDLDRIVMVDLMRCTPAEAFRMKRNLAEQIAQLLAGLANSGLTHRDMKASNILIANMNTGAAEVPYILDLDGLGAARRQLPGGRWQPLARLAASLMGYRTITRTDYVRCLRNYLVFVPKDDRKWKAVFRRLARRAARHALRSQGRKGDKLDGHLG